MKRILGTMRVTSVAVWGITLTVLFMGAAFCFMRLFLSSPEGGTYTISLVSSPEIFPLSLNLYHEQSRVFKDNSGKYCFISFDSGDHIVTAFYDIPETVFPMLYKSHAKVVLTFPEDTNVEMIYPSVALQERSFAHVYPLTASYPSGQNTFTFDVPLTLREKGIRVLLMLPGLPTGVSVVLPERVDVFVSTRMVEFGDIVRTVLFLPWRYIILIAFLGGLLHHLKKRLLSFFEPSRILSHNPWVLLFLTPLVACILYGLWFGQPNYGNTDEEMYRTLAETLFYTKPISGYMPERLSTILPIAVLYELLPRIYADFFYHSVHLILGAVGIYFFLLQCTEKANALYISFAMALFPISVFYAGTPYPSGPGCSYMYAAMGALSLALAYEDALRRRISVAATGVFVSLVFSTILTWGVIICWLPGYYLVAQRKKPHYNYAKEMLHDALVFSVAFLGIQLLLCVASLCLNGYFFYMKYGINVALGYRAYWGSMGLLYPEWIRWVVDHTNHFFLLSFSLGAGVFFICVWLFSGKDDARPPALFVLLIGIAAWFSMIIMQQDLGRLFKLDTSSQVFPFTVLLFASSAAVLSEREQRQRMVKRNGTFAHPAILALIAVGVLVAVSCKISISIKHILFYCVALSLLLHALLYWMSMLRFSLVLYAIIYFICTSSAVSFTFGFRQHSFGRYIWTTETLPMIAKSLDNSMPNGLSCVGVWGNTAYHRSVIDYTIGHRFVFKIQPSSSGRFVNWYFPYLVPSPSSRFLNSMGAKLLKPGQCIVIMLEGQLPDRLLEADKALLYVQKSLAPYNLRARLYASPLLAPHPSGVFLFVPIVLSELKEDEVGSFLPNTVREAFEERGLISVFGGLSRLIKPDNPRLFVVDPVRDVIPIERAFTTIQNSDHALVYDPISFPRDLFIPKILAVIPHGKENGNAIIEIRDQNNKLIGSSKISEMGFPVLFDLPWAEMEIPKSYEENYSSLSCTVFSMDENAVVLPEELEIWFGIEGDTVR